MKKNRPPIFSTTINLDLVGKFRQDLKEKGFTFSHPEHTIFSAKKKGITCTVYKSGSLVVSGKEKDDFIEFYLEPEILKTFKFTHPEADLNLTARIGVDEAGKGDFFGPLCIASIFAKGDGIKNFLSLKVQDSKRFSDSSIIKINKKIKKSYPHVIIRLFPQKYNELMDKFKNLNHLLAWGHATAIATLVEKTSCNFAVIDQFAKKSLVHAAIKKKKIALELEQKHKGEEDIVVAAASILARAAFLEGLEELSNEIAFKLPKGASPIVKQAGVKIIRKYGTEILNKIAKVHFKTKKQIIKEADLTGN